jgi:H+/Cl- antiporter ClcA
MAHLEVEPKPSRPWWVWLLIVLLGILLAGLLLRKCSTEKATNTADRHIQTPGSKTEMCQLWFFQNNNPAS